MRKLYCSIAVFAFFLILLDETFVFGQKTGKPSVAKKVEYLKTPDARLEKALRKWSEGDTAFRYHYNKVDLNADGKTDAVVFVSGEQFCGSGGCRILILKNNGRNYQLTTEMSVSRPPIWVARTKTKGWNDLLFFNSGGGIEAYYSLLKFNGKTYPTNPTIEPALPKKNKQEFVEYLSGIENYSTGLEIK